MIIGIVYEIVGTGFTLMQVYRDYPDPVTISPSCRDLGSLNRLEVPEEVLPSISSFFELGEASAINGGL